MTMPTQSPAAACSEGTPPAGSGAQPATVLDVLRLLRAEPDDAAAAAAARFAAPLRRVRPGDTLIHEGARVETVYFVRSGTFKLVSTAEDGYEQVLGFPGRGEVLGLDALCLGEHPTAAVALEHASVYGIAGRDLLAIALQVPTLDRVLHLAASRGLGDRARLADVMAAVAAEVRLARFLVQWSQRMAAAGESPTRLHLRMSRRDIASHLGVAHETVSRSFTAMAGWGFLRVSNREVELLRMDELKAFSRSTRRSSSDSGAFAHELVSLRAAEAGAARRPHPSSGSSAFMAGALAARVLPPPNRVRS